MKLDHINLLDLVNAVREVAEKFPHQEVDLCVYFDPKEGYPVCLIGRALSRLGVSSEEFDPDTNNSRISLLLTDAGHRQDDQSVVWLQQVQDLQDLKAPWLSCVNEADGEVAF